MEIRKIPSIVLCSALAIGLSACSGSQYRGDDSPWKSKHDADQRSTSSEEFVELSLDEEVEVDTMEEPVAEEMMIDSSMAEPDMVESEAVAEPELETFSDFDPEPVPVESMSAFERLEAGEPVETESEVVAIETVEEAPAAEVSDSDIMSSSSSAYAVQVFAGRVLANLNRYVSTHGLENMQIVKTDHDGDIINVLVSIHDSREEAEQAAMEIEESTGSKPWVRSVAGLQNMTVE